MFDGEQVEHCHSHGDPVAGLLEDHAARRVVGDVVVDLDATV